MLEDDIGSSQKISCDVVRTGRKLPVAPGRGCLNEDGSQAGSPRHLDVSGLITDAGFVPVDLGGTADAAPMEAPHRNDAVYGEEYREREAREAAGALRAGRPLPPLPRY